jgi:hypothetical protein
MRFFMNAPNNANAENQKHPRHYGPFVPEFIRLPPAGTLCPHTGLNRTKMWRILEGGHVQHVSLKPEGAKRGVRLIKLESLLAYLNSLIEGGDDKPAPQSSGKQTEPEKLLAACRE